MTWNEADHPRDDIGRFTDKGGGGSSTSSNSQQSEKSKFEKMRDEIVRKEKEQERKMKERADILYGKDEEYYKKFPHRNYPQFNGNMTGGAANMVIENTKYPQFDGYMTGGASSIVTDEISGVKRGEPKSIEDAIQGVNPNYSGLGINTTYKTNCQASVIVLDARTRGFDIEVSLPYESEIKRKLSYYPNIAYIDPKTGKEPEFIPSKAKNIEELKTWLQDSVKPGEKHIFAYKNKSSDPHDSTGHVVLVTKNSNNELEIYDPQINKKREKPEDVLSKVQINFDWNEEKNPPKILRVDDKEFNKKILNQISKPSH